MRGWDAKKLFKVADDSLPSGREQRWLNVVLRKKEDKNAQLLANCKQLKGIDYSYYYESEE